jgi:uncharacterized membrane protein YhaH (DUF805 family)
MRLLAFTYRAIREEFGPGPFSAHGRANRQSHFWGQVWNWIVGTFLAAAAGPFGVLIGVMFLYRSVCLASRRLHDLGRTGWLQLINTALSVGFFGVLWLGASVPPADGAATVQILNDVPFTVGDTDYFLPSGVLGVVGSVLFLISLGFQAFMFLWPGQTGPNAYGERAY